MSSPSWGTPGCVTSLFEPNWLSLPVGSVCDIVCDLVCLGDPCSLAVLKPSGRPCRVIGLPPDASGTCTLFRVSLADGLRSGEPLFRFLESSTLRVHQPLSSDHFLNLVEFCAGCGASSVGLTEVGFNHRVAVEWNEPMAKLHQRIHEKVPVITGDIGEVQTLIQLSKLCPEPFSLMAGVSCQPYSRGGSQAGGQDSRAQTVPSVSKAVYLLQIPLLILECVVPATNAFVRSHLDHLCQQLGMRLSECILKLEDTWAANRARWWVVAVNSRFGEIQLPQIPGLGKFVVQDLIPYVIDWPPSEQQQITLTNEEDRVFQKYGPPRKFAVKMDQKLPTALHSWGGQATSCACGCRKSGFSLQLLEERGLFAQLFPVIDPKTGESRWRHLHVKEVSLLNGLPPQQNWGNDQRLNLAAAGQMASPLQAAWIGGLTIKHIFSVLGRSDWKEPLDCVNNINRQVLEQTQILFPKMEVTKEDLSLVRLWFVQNPEVALEIKVSPQATARQLRDAELKLTLCDEEDCTLEDGVTGAKLALDATVAGLSIRVAGACMENSPTCAPPTLIDDKSFSDDGCRLGGNTDVQIPADPTVVSKNTGGQGTRSVTTVLPNSHLTDLVPPLVTDFKMSAAFRAQQVLVQDRLEVLNNQGVVMGDDEVIWHLKNACEEVPNTAMLDPLLALGWLNNPASSQVDSWLSNNPKVNTVVTALWSHGHWTPIVWNASGSQLEVCLWDVHLTDTSRFNSLHHAFCQGFNKPRYVVAHSIRSFGEQEYCGAAAVAFARYRFKLSPLPETLTSLQNFHDAIRMDFVTHLHSVDQTLRPWCWGKGMFDVTNGLVALLQSHGVPAKVAPSRAKLVLQSLGKDSVEHALEGGSPWKSLKALANSHAPPVRLVLQDELTRNQQSKPLQKTKKTGNKPAVVRPADLDPTKLELEPGTFVDQSGVAMPQIPLTHVGPLATGVALTSLLDAQTFLRAGNVLTHGSLALLILHPVDDLPTPLIWSSVRFAAKCTANQEPLLLTGALVQLGKSPIAFNTSCQPPLAQVDVACARVTVYQDQWEGSWEDFQARPVRLVLNKLVPLSICKVEKCSCTAWHNSPGNGDIPSPLLDVFRRQFFTDAGRPVEWSKATYYAFSIRYNKEQETKLLQCSGLGGIYLEPKTEDAAAPDGNYQVVWLPQHDFASVKHQAQCEPSSIGLARNGNRFGVRVPLKNFQEVFRQLKPSSLFLAPGPRSSWVCGPWPFGVDRKTIAQVFKDWKWDARPTQPTHAVSGGMMWNIQAITEPPKAVVSMPHGQVVITKQKEQSQPNDAGPPPVVGQNATMKLCQAQSPNSDPVDPWSIRDPWQNFTPQAEPKPIAPPVHLAEMEARLEKSIMAKLPVDRMDDDGQEQRLQALECQMQQMANRQVSLEATVQDHQVHSAAQIQQLQSQMMNQMESQSRQMQSPFENQTNKSWRPFWPRKDGMSEGVAMGWGCLILNLLAVVNLGSILGTGNQFVSVHFVFGTSYSSW